MGYDFPDSNFPFDNEKTPRYGSIKDIFFEYL